MEGTSETFETGGGDMIVTGIATVWTPTIESLKKAISLKHNFVISMVPPYWHEPGTVKPEISYGPPTSKALEASPAYQIKKKLIGDNGLTIFRFSENYSALASNPRLNALAKVLGYNGHEVSGSAQKLQPIRAAVYSLPETSLIELAKGARDRANAKALRVLGDPAAKVKNVGLIPGYVTNADFMQLVHDRNVDVVVCGEACEWEAFEYAEDWITADWGKGFIMLGRAASEDPGAVALADWIKTCISEVPITGIAVGEPFNYVPSHKA
jgi:hypothetical protein